MTRSAAKKSPSSRFLCHIVESPENGGTAADGVFSDADAAIAQRFEKGDGSRARLQADRAGTRSRLTLLETRLDLFDDPPPVTEAAEVAEDEDVMNEVVVIVDEEIPVFILRSFGRVAIRVLERGHAHEFLFPTRIRVISEKNSGSRRRFKVLSGHFSGHLGEFPSSLVRSFHFHDGERALMKEERRR